MGAAGILSFNQNSVKISLFLPNMEKRKWTKQALKTTSSSSETFFSLNIFSNPGPVIRSKVDRELLKIVSVIKNDSSNQSKGNAKPQKKEEGKFYKEKIAQ